MSGFSSDWLALREPADAAARSASLCDAVGARDGPALEVVDLGAGTGSNLRYAAPRLGGRQRWRLVDDDDALLASIPAAMRAWAGGFPPRGDGFECEIDVVHADLAADLDMVDWPKRGLVTASALLDLVSPGWLDALADRCACAGARALFALTYDGRLSFYPPDADDERVRARVNLHQRRDKGFGPALGPAAGAAAAAAFERRGYTLRAAASDWRLEPSAARLQSALIHGWAAAAAEISPGERDALAAWARRREAHIEAGRGRTVVGHIDLAAWPGGRQ